MKFLVDVVQYVINVFKSLMKAGNQPKLRLSFCWLSKQTADEEIVLCD